MFVSRFSLVRDALYNLLRTCRRTVTGASLVALIAWSPTVGEGAAPKSQASRKPAVKRPAVPKAAPPKKAPTKPTKPTKTANRPASSAAKAKPTSPKSSSIVRIGITRKPTAPKSPVFGNRGTASRGGTPTKAGELRAIVADNTGKRSSLPDASKSTGRMTTLDKKSSNQANDWRSAVSKLKTTGKAQRHQEDKEEEKEDRAELVESIRTSGASVGASAESIQRAVEEAEKPALDGQVVRRRQRIAETEVVVDGAGLDPRLKDANIDPRRTLKTAAELDLMGSDRSKITPETLKNGHNNLIKSELEKQFGVAPGLVDSALGSKRPLDPSEIVKATACTWKTPRVHKQPCTRLSSSRQSGNNRNSQRRDVEGLKTARQTNRVWSLRKLWPITSGTASQCRVRRERDFVAERMHRAVAKDGVPACQMRAAEAVALPAVVLSDYVGAWYSLSPPNAVAAMAFKDTSLISFISASGVLV